MSEKDPGTEEATPQRLEKLRQQGDVPVSREVATAGCVVFLAVFVSQGAPAFGRHLAALMQAQLAGLSSSASLPAAQELGQAARLGAEPIAGWLLAAMVVLGAVAFGGASACVSLERVEPRLERLDPVAGLSRMLSLDALVAAVRGAMVASLLVATSTLVWHGARAWFASGPSTPIDQIQHIAHDLLLRGTATMAASMVGLALLDVLVVRWRYNKRHRMTREDIKQEVKEHEGEPATRARRRRRQRELLKGMVSSTVPTASVVVANPTHVAVALRYRQGVDAAPVVVAKGTDLVALRIRKLATQNSVPVITQRELARALLRSVSVGQVIPSRFYRAVAEVLAHVQRQRLARSSSGRAAETGQHPRRVARLGSPPPMPERGSEAAS